MSPNTQTIRFSRQHIIQLHPYHTSPLRNKKHKWVRDPCGKAPLKPQQINDFDGDVVVLLAHKLFCGNSCAACYLELVPFAFSVSVL